MKVYVVEHVYGNGHTYTHAIIDVYDHISKAGRTIWEKILDMCTEESFENDTMSMNDIIKARGAKYKRNNGIDGYFIINEREVL